MRNRKTYFLKGKESMIDHIKSIEELGCVYWKKAKNKHFQIGEQCYLYLIGKGHNQIRYYLEVVDISCKRDDECCWNVPFEPDHDCYKLKPIGNMYQGHLLSLAHLEELGIKRATQFKILTPKQSKAIRDIFQ